MRGYHLLSLLIISIVLIFACGPSNSVSVKKFSPQGEVNKLTSFTIEFNKDLAPNEKWNEWSDEEYIKFSPAISGKYKWISENTLIFSPDKPLDPMQEYKASITEKVLFKTKFTPDFDEYKFFTPKFDVLKMDFFWTQLANENYKLSIKTNIYFNHPVNPNDLSRFLSIKIGNNQLGDFQIITQQASDVIAIDLGEISQTEKEQEIKITIQQGLSSILGKTPTEIDRTFEHTLPPITRLAITAVGSGFDGNIGWITVSTTQMVDEKSLPNFISVTPDRELNFSVSENQFRIEGDFKDIPSIDLIIKKGLPGLFGGELEFEFERIISLVDLEPSINFSDNEGIYLLKGGEQNLSVKTVNIEEVDITYYKIFKNNLLHFMDRNSYYFYDDYYNSYGRDYRVGNFGREIFTEKKKLKGNQNWLDEFNINMNNVLEDKYEGIYVVTVRSSEDYWRRDSKIISLSDIGIIAKQSYNNLMVFTNSISGANPIKNAEVSVISNNNQILVSGTTDAQGVINFEDFAAKTEGFYASMIFVESGDDFNYLSLNQSEVETSRFDVGGRYDPNGFSTFIYSERNLYRPGEDVNISAIVRTEKIEIVKDIPLTLKIITPTGKTFASYSPKLNDEGSFEIKLSIPDYASTGQYSASLYTGNKKFIGSYSFGIEEFVPDKIRVKLSNNKENFSPGQTVINSINAEYFFGAKASDLKFETEIQLREQAFFSKKYPKFSFHGFSQKFQPFEKQIIDGTLDKNGEAQTKFIIPNSVQSGGVLKGFQFVSIFDPTGRTVNRIATFDVYPQKFYLGIKSDRYYQATNSNILYQFVAVDENDNSAEIKDAVVTLIRYEWNTVLKKDYSGRYRYVSEKKAITEWQKEIKIKAEPTDFSFSVSRSGQYELRINQKHNNNYVVHTFYAYGWASRTASSFSVDKEGRVEIVLDKERYQPGETAKALFTAPFSGKILVTFERDSVYNYRYIDIENGSAEMEFKITESYLPNVFITATLFKPHTQEQTTPFLVGHGFSSLIVEKKETELDVEIIAAEKVKPNTTQKVKVISKPQEDIFVTIAAVDEGILQVKDYATPDPHGFMYAFRGLKVSSHDLYKFLLPEILSLNSSPAGDAMAAQLKKRTNPIKSKRFNLVSYWSGIRKTDSNGEVEIQFNIPQFNGELRLMALAYKGNSFGSAYKPMKVADDLIIEPQIPRVLSLNDELIMPVTIINNTEDNDEIVVDVKVEGPLKIVSEQRKTFKIEEKGSIVADFVIRAEGNIGDASIEISTSGLAEVKEKVNIAVRPSSPFITESGAGIISANNEVNILFPENFIPSTSSRKLTVSSFPAIKYAKQLKYLVGYPHGCIEQTVSKLFPQLYFEELAKLVAPELYKHNNPVYFVKEGIRKIESMQLYNGSMAYWQGGTSSSWWGSVYAAHFLIEAKNAGFKVDQKVLSNLLSYLSKEVKNKKTYDYVTYYGNRRTVKKIAKKEIIYSLYILAAAGESDLATMNYYKAHPYLLSKDMVYLLAGAYALAGKWTAAFDILPGEFEAVKTDTESGGNFDSDIRANAIILNVLLQIDPENAQIPYIVEFLSKNLDRAYSTQERSFAFLALGKAAKRNVNDTIKIEIISDNKVISNFTGIDVVLLNDNFKSAAIKLKASGEGRAYYFWEAEGIKLDGKFDEEDSSMKIRRSYYDYRTGSQILNNQFDQGQLIVGKISLTGMRRSAENIVISDLIPAGTEIENPRLSQTSRIQFDEKNKMNIQYMDIRDDRLFLFTDLSAGKTKEFHYLLRVTNKGKYNLPPIAAEAMYDREFHSVSGGGIILIN